VSFSANLKKGWRARQGFGRSDLYFVYCVVFEFNLSKGYVFFGGTMKMKLWIVLFAIFLTACQASMGKQLESAEVCISPPETFAYSLNPQDDYIQFPDTSAFLPGQLVSTIESDFEFADIFGIRIQGNHQEIWLGARQRKFLIYDPNLEEWDEALFGLGNRIWIEKLFFTPDGTVFGVPDLTEHDKPSGFSVLSKYNEESKTFEFVKTLQGIPISSKSDVYTVTQVVFDSQRGLFWFLVPDDAIYSYDPETQEIEKHINIPGEEEYDILEARISGSGKIYFLSYRGFVYAHINGNGNFMLTKFDPVTSLVEQFSLPLLPWPPAYHLFVDRSERIWFGTAGWLDPDGTWYQMFPSPIFLTNIRFSGLDYRWQSPTIELESKDGRIWMKSANGLVWLDPDEEKWCWCSSRSSNIFEDVDGNLWIVADNKLYKILIDIE
jgi:hypothetical protein